MERLLITAATITEIKPFLNCFKNKKKVRDDLYSVSNQKVNIDILISGIGIVSTIYNLTKHLQGNNYKLIINAGIAGSSDSGIKTGQVVEVTEEEFADFGIVLNNRFISASDHNFIPETSVFSGNILVNPVKSCLDIPKVKGCTVNTIDYDRMNKSLISDAQIETMEGAAFFFVCLNEKIPFIEFRSISNRAGDGNKSNWQIDESVRTLSETLTEFISNL
ncbi:MAG: hypothetical protein ABIJ97_09525 [Bacteroidota bacterium]